MMAIETKKPMVTHKRMEVHTYTSVKIGGQTLHKFLVIGRINNCSAQIDSPSKLPNTS
jgi:hypothetical protein